MVIVKENLCTVQCNHYKVFTLQYIAADGGSKVSYHSEISEEQRMKAACKRKARQDVSIKDSTASLGPPDKKQHFDNNHGQVNKPKAQIKKGQPKTDSIGEKLEIDNGDRHEVEVRYHDGRKDNLC